MSCKYTIEVHGKKVKAEFLGCGSWTTAYKYRGSVYLFTNSGDRSKDFISRMPQMTHIPEITFLGRNNSGQKIYKSVYYHCIKERSRAWRYYRRLNKIFGFFDVCSRGLGEFEGKLLRSKLPKSLCEALRVVANHCFEYGYNLEFQIFNLAVDDNGRLVLLDVFFPQHEDYSEDY